MLINNNNIIIFNISIALFTIKDQKRFTLLYIKKSRIVNLITGIPKYRILKLAVLYHVHIYEHIHVG